jgi:hypothetical protein
MKDLVKESVEKEYIFPVSQSASTYYYGDLTIKASSLDDAIEKVKNMSDHEIDNAVDNWELAEDADASGDVEVNFDDVDEL